ncbi:hypothetical protein ALC60_05958, partial [Trachymyrmex zeteki]
VFSVSRSILGMPTFREPCSPLHQGEEQPDINKVHETLTFQEWIWTQRKPAKRMIFIFNMLQAKCASGQYRHCPSCLLYNVNIARAMSTLLNAIGLGNVDTAHLQHIP